MDEVLLGNHERACFEVIDSFTFEEVAATFSTAGSRVASEFERLDYVDSATSKGSSTRGGGTSFGLYIRKGNGALI